MISKVCRLVWDYPVGGRASYGLQPVFVNLSEEQVRLGYEVHVIAPNPGGLPAEESSNGVSIHRIGGPYSVKALFRLQQLIGGGGEWVVHGHATCGFFLTPTKHLRRFPLVCHSHITSQPYNVIPTDARGESGLSSGPSLKLAYYMLREKLYWSSADLVLAVSGATRNDIVQGYGIEGEKVRVVHNGVDPALFSPGVCDETPEKLRELEDKRLVLFVGHFGRGKGIVHLIRAMRHVRAEIPDAHLVCVGGVPAWLPKFDYWGALEREAALNGVERDVTLLNRVPNRELVGYYRAASVFVLPSYHEAFSKVCLEAMACGKPVVATRSGGLQEAVEDGETGFLIPYGSPPEIAEAIVTLLQDQALATKMGKKGRIRVENEFTWRAAAGRVRQAYDSIVQ